MGGDEAHGRALPDKMASTAPYRPTSRRPIGEPFRATARGAVRACVRFGIHPDVISYLSIVAAGLAAIGFWQSGRRPWLLLVAPVFCYLRLWFNMLDGMVALASGKASRHGEILNDLPDRISDALIFAGVAHSGWNAQASGYWAAILALLTAYVGTFGQAVGAGRQFGGVMSKPWRMVTLHTGAWATLACVLWNQGRVRIGGLTILDWTCLVVVAGCIETIAVRLGVIMRALKDAERPGTKV
jgi:phosphatidylglycerophosphate synthase